MNNEELKSEITKDAPNTFRYTMGEHLFKEGDPGGDLLLIEFGEVQVYKFIGETRLDLAVMKQGELIGCFTCLTAAPRTASVVAKSAVRCRIIKHETIQKAIGTLPRWFSIILKEYGIRLGEIEQALARSKELANSALANQANSLYHGKQYCHALISLSSYHKVVIENEDLVLVDSINQAISETLGVDLEIIKKVGKAFLDGGLLLKKVEPDKKRDVFPLIQCEKLIDFPQFIELAKSGKSKNMVESRWPTKTIAMGRALTKFCQLKSLGTNQDVRIGIDTLAEELKKATGTEYDEADCALLIEFLLVKIEGENDLKAMRFHPAKLGRTLAKLRTYQMLIAMDKKTAAE